MAKRFTEIKDSLRVLGKTACCDHVAARDELKEWTLKKGEDGIRTYWSERNRLSVDGRKTGIERVLGD